MDNERYKAYGIRQGKAGQYIPPPGRGGRGKLQIVVRNGGRGERGKGREGGREEW